MPIGWVEMRLHVYQKQDRRRLSVWREMLLCVCAASLLLVLANRVPRFSSYDPGWARAVPSAVTAKLLAKDFYLLQPPAPELFFLSCVEPNGKTFEQAHPLYVPWDDGLYTRPPPVC